MEQYLFNLSQPVEDLGDAKVQPNLWLLTCDELPPLLFSARGGQPAAASRPEPDLRPAPVG